MPGINLSQSLQEKRAQARGRFLDQGFFLSMGILVLLLIVFGGARWYASRLEQEVRDLESKISETTSLLRGEKVDRIVDFTERAKTAVNELATEPDPTELLRQLEVMTLPSIRLTGYRFDRTTDRLIVGGLATNLKEVAQQMLAFKSMKHTDQIFVDKIEYQKSGKVAFSFIFLQSKPVEGVTQ